MAKKIYLTQGKFTLVDDSDFEWLNSFIWSYHQGYAERHTPTINGKRTIISIHKMLMNPPKGKEVDHINGNRNDNRRNNLRIVSYAGQARNAGLRKDSTSGFKGVSWHRYRKAWSVRICVNYKRIFIGYFNNLRDAGLAYNNAAIKYFGEFARLNKV